MEESRFKPDAGTQFYVPILYSNEKPDIPRYQEAMIEELIAAIRDFATKEEMWTIDEIKTDDPLDHRWRIKARFGVWMLPKGGSGE